MHKSGQDTKKSIAVTAAALALLGMVALVTAAVSGPASAAARPGPARPGIARSAAPVARDLADVACRTARDCIAVDPLDSPTPVAEIWNGKAWHSVRVSLPAGTHHGSLDAVACPGASECVAVGEDFPDPVGGYNYALGDIWNGKAWAPTQLSESAETALAAVSCLSPKSCLAVGSENSPEGGYGSPIAYAWNGAKWVSLTVPPQSYDWSTAFTDVSCVAGRFCLVAGYSPTKSGALTTLLYRWNGRTWTALKPAAPPKGVTSLQLNYVSCASPTRCVAVGDGHRKAAAVAIAEVWNGRAWKVTAPIAWPRGTTNPSPNGVSCATASSCLATGSIDKNQKDDGITGRAAASVWNGRTWRATSVPAPGRGKASDFGGVTCLRPTFCAVVGSTEPYDGAPGTGTALSGFWNGKSWRLVSLK